MKRIRIVPVFCVLLFVTLVIYTTAHAQVETKLLPSDGAEGDQFGIGLDIWGKYLMVGSCYDDNENGIDAGAVYVFKREPFGNVWPETQKLLASGNPDSTDYFGYTVNIDGDYAIIGSPWSDDDGEKSGSAYIFKLDGTTWLQQAKLTAFDGAPDDRFGISAAISGDYALVGAFFDDDFGNRSGSAYIFKRDGEVWSQQTKLVPADSDTNDWFGVNVSLTGDYAVICSRYDDNEKGNDAGAVYIFKRNGDSWTEQSKITPADSLGLGDTLLDIGCIDGNTLVVGGKNDDERAKNGGSMYIYFRYGESWLPVNHFFPNDTQENDQFGASLDIYGDRIVVGASGVDYNNNNNSGACYIYRWDGVKWFEEMKITPTDPDTLDNFGFPVAIYKNYVLVGARYSDTMGNNAGAAYVYELEATNITDTPQTLVNGFALGQNYPNPFNPETSIDYSLDKSGHVRVVIYNTIGQEIKTLVNTVQQAGHYTIQWNGRDNQGHNMPSGLYLYRLVQNNRIITGKAVLMR
ncbi:MAG TPA: FlgD immunoglobulin-like domain containing protein [bacterium]|nr:FlgD immunoglobulin-like domain containing protein [bacterium]HPN43508.1 FlgD immunoglobulin-like domain containing protein [bacterium]